MQGPSLDRAAADQHATARKFDAEFGAGAHYRLTLQLHHDFWHAEQAQPVRVAPIAWGRTPVETRAVSR